MTAYDYNFANDKPDIREVIPAGVPLHLQFSYAPGGYDIGPDGKLTTANGGPLTKSKPPSDTAYLKAELTVLSGPYKGRKFWSNMTVIGGELDEKGVSKAGKITRGNIRSILDSANGLSSKDDSPAAAAKRVLPQGFKSLQGIRFIAKSKVEPPQNGYPAKNGLGTILTIDQADYPKSQAELDNPTIPQQAGAKAAPALPTPAFVTVSPATPQAPQVAAPAGSPAAAIGTQGNAVPAWAQ